MDVRIIGNTMRDVYVGYYPPSEEGFKRLWQQGTIVLDTNVLLNLYRVSQATRDEVFAVLRKLEGRLWLPYQVGLEFHQRRLTVINEQHAFIVLCAIYSSAHKRTPREFLGACARTL
jgi:hypothetical protein